MNKKFKLLITLVAVIAFGTGCKHKAEQEINMNISPEAGTAYKAGDVVKIGLSFNAGTQVDSIVYLLDSVKMATKKDSSAFSFKTDSMPLGIKVITARAYTGGQSQDASTNIVLKAAKAPEELTYQVIKTYPHDTSAYTEGLLYQDGYLYESGGGYLDPPSGQPADGQSSLRKVDLATGKPIMKVMVDPKVFGEGISIVGDKLIQLTWTSKVAYEYDLKTFKLLRTFPFNVGVEGWGMCFDGKQLYMDDSTNRIWFLNKDNCTGKGFIDVYDDKKAIDSINELEYVNGKIYANVYQTNIIIIIDPKTGAVLSKIDLSALYPEPRTPPADVLNGIAWDEKGKRLFVTGKKWPHLYQVKFVPKKP